MDVTLKQWPAIPGFPAADFVNDRDLADVLRRLKMGSLMRNFSIRKNKSEPCTFQIDLDTRRVLWSHHHAEGSIDIKEIREIREGKSCRDFERLVEESIDEQLCFSIHHGQEFTLRIISVSGR